ncbi:MAG: NADH-ubiquinone oxidoreductase-F iron-sulfur binding region domain-containing protein [Candidatus Dormibacteria bacterium]
MIGAAVVPRLLDGPAGEGAEPLSAHRQRLGPCSDGGPGLLDEIERSGLRGRGGGGYPTARKMRAVAQRARGDAVVVANGAETEPLNRKDHVLMARRPHLVLDGLRVAARAVGAPQAVVYVTADNQAVAAAVRTALEERRRAGEADPRVSLVMGPKRYIAGEEMAVVSVINGGPARPAMVPPRPHERGVEGRPTLMQNVETLADIALVASHGADWFAGAGGDGATGSVLVTAAGSIHDPGVHEIANGSTVAHAVSRAGGALGSTSAVLVGGYFGRWVSASDAWDLRLGIDIPLGSGLLAVFPHSHCGVAQVAAITAFLARESARQCGPCQHGLFALASTMEDLAAGRAKPADSERLQRWIGQIAGRGACHHPDGALAMLESGLRAFAGDVNSHLRRRRCDRDSATLLPTPDWTAQR